MWTSQTIGGLLNATLGNMVEVSLNSHPFLLAQALMQVALM
jgi:Ca2+/H+ antiporter